MMVALLAPNMVNQWLVVKLTAVSWFDLDFVGVYASVIAAWAAIELLEWALTPQLFVSYAAAVAVSVAALRLNRRQLAIADTFPELLRFPVLGRLLA